MQHGAVVPHDQHIRLPAVAIDEAVVALPLLQFHQQRQRFGIGHPLDADDIAQRRIKAAPPSLGVGRNQRMRLRRQCRLARPDVHAAPLGLIASAIAAVRRIGQAGGVDGDQIAQLGLARLRQRLPCGMLVSKQRVAAMRRDGHRAQTGARRWMRLETPVGMPVLGKDRRGFIRIAAHGGDMLAARDRREEGILAEPAHRQRQRLEIVIAHCLSGEGQHMMLQPCRADFRRRIGRNRLGQVDARHGCTAGLAARHDGQRHAAKVRASDGPRQAACGQAGRAPWRQT